MKDYLKETFNYGVVYFSLGVSCTGLFLTALWMFALKLVNYVSWSWWLILIPVYAPLAIFILSVIIVAAVITYKDMKDKLKS